jgi:hypothetical protein
MGGEMLKARLFKNLKYAATPPIPFPAFIVMSFQMAQAESTFLLRSPAVTISALGPALFSKNLLKREDKVVVKSGCTKLTVTFINMAYNYIQIA